MLEVTMAMYSNIKSKVRTTEGNSASFYQLKGLMQGECTLNDLEECMNDIDEMAVVMNGR